MIHEHRLKPLDFDMQGVVVSLQLLDLAFGFVEFDLEFVDKVPQKQFVVSQVEGLILEIEYEVSHAHQARLSGAYSVRSVVDLRVCQFSPTVGACMGGEFFSMINVHDTWRFLAA